MLTRLAKEKLNAVIAEACTAQTKLEATPSTTGELADSLVFCDEIQERVTQTYFMIIFLQLPLYQCPPL